MTRALLFLCILSTCACGQYIAYDSDATPTPPVTATVDDFPAVEEMEHVALSGIMAQYVSKSMDDRYVYFDYKALANTTESVFMLDYYLATIASVDPSTLKDAAERQAYWYNAYNAAVIRGVLREFDQSLSFQVIDQSSFFNDPFYQFGGVNLSLNQVEQGVLRGDFDHENVVIVDEATLTKIKTWHDEVWSDGKVDARLHAALNCGALGCPNLPDRPPYVWRAGTLEQDLSTATTRWLDNPEKGAGPEGISNLFEWYKQDFVDDAGSVEAFIQKYRSDQTQDVKLDTIVTYDWTLNAPENGK